MTITVCTLKTYRLVTVCFVFGVLICQLHLVESITFTNTGFKFCLIKCIQYGCPGIKYNVENQTCQHLDLEMMMGEIGQLFGTMDLPDVGTGDCGFKTCQGMRCPKTCARQISCAKGGRDQAQTQNTGSSTLIDACRNGDLPQVKHILSQGTANINTREYDRTPAMIAVNEGHREILELLVKKGSDLSQLDDDQNNILHLASKEGHLEIVKYIHSLNIIDIESRGVHGKTPIMLAALFGQTGVFVFLVEMGAHLSLLDDSAENILHLSCRGGDEKIVKYIIKLNVVDINSKQLGGKTAVSLAAASGNRAAFDNLVEMRADLLAVDVLGNSVLHLACQGGNMDIVKYAVKQNIVDINSRRADGRTPASIAAVSGHSALFQYLVKVGADMSVVDVYGDNILHSSSAGGNMDIVKYVCKQNIVDINTKAAFGETPASIAATYGHLAVLEYLVKSGANLSAVNEDGDNILHLACQGGDLDTVKYVLNLNVVDINSKGIDGYTPLMLARELEDRDVFDLLIESGADVPVENYDRDNVFRMDMITFCKMCCHTAWQF